MTVRLCPVDGVEIAHPRALVCTPCSRRLPQHLRRALFRAHNHGVTAAGRDDLLTRISGWIDRHPIGPATTPPKGPHP